VVVSPDSSKVFVTGESAGATSGADYATVAYRAGTGAVLWTKRYNGSANGYDAAMSLAVSRDGTKVFVTGQSTGTTSSRDFATVAYRTGTGAAVWANRYNGPANGDDRAFSVAVSPNSTRVIVTGESAGTASGADITTRAYAAGTGALQWSKRYNGPGNGYDSPYQVAVSPDGTKVVVVGESEGAGTNADFTTLAYRLGTGSSLWTKRYNGAANGYDGGFSVAISPDSSKVFVTGETFKAGPDYDYTTFAYRAGTGAQLWNRKYDTTAHNDDDAAAIAVSHDGSRVFVTGESDGPSGNYDYATISYRTT
jgi:hypothetical protein